MTNPKGFSHIVVKHVEIHSQHGVVDVSGKLNRLPGATGHVLTNLPIKVVHRKHRILLIPPLSGIGSMMTPSAAEETLLESLPTMPKGSLVIVFVISVEN